VSDERSYTNPVYGANFADPFVLKFNGEYYAFGTGSHGDGTFPVLHSTDLVRWHPRGTALLPLPGAVAAYWAPEVAYHNGTFYMYYSAGGPEGEGHQLRVATAEHPVGPFRDSGRILTPNDPFTIDAHPFRDDDGTWYLFYCHDFLEGERVGTGIIVDRMLDMMTLAGEPRTVVRPFADWNVYQRQRFWYGRVWDWYTIEGAFTRKHNNRYHCFYSGGAWREPNYGVGCAVADHPLGPYSVERSAAGPEILRTDPGRVIGPGHMSVAVAPDNLHEYLVYHAWDVQHTRRMMRIDPLVWRDDGPDSSGPSTSPRSLPPTPLFRDLFDQPDGTSLEGSGWRILQGDWRVQDGQAHQTNATAPYAAALIDAVPPQRSFVFEANLRLEPGIQGASGGVYVYCVDQDNYMRLELHGEQPELVWQCKTAGQITHEQTISLAPLGPGFRADVYHQVIAERRDSDVKIRVDGVPVASFHDLPDYAGRPGLFTHNAAAAFDGIALTMLEP
jgi:GH43 family beta-xylosidase